MSVSAIEYQTLIQQDEKLQYENVQEDNRRDYSSHYAPAPTARGPSADDQLRGFLNQSSDGILVVNDAGLITQWNPALVEITGLAPDDVVGSALPDVMASLLPQEGSTGSGHVRVLRAILSDALATGRVEWLNSALSSKIRAADGTVRDIDATFFPMTSPPATTFGCTVRDVTSQVSLQEDLLAAQTKLRELHAYFESVREEERRSIARELHDELGHELTALKMDLRWLQHVGADRDADGVRRRVDGMLELTDRSIQWIRRVSSELRPSLLDDVGLAAAVEWKAEEFERHTDMCCTVRVPKDPRPIESRKATALYRILQEALTNAARHSQADAVGIVLEQDDEVVTLRVCDNGRGITQTEANDPDAFGLLGIRERARVLGGSAHVYGNEAEGTTVAVRMPYEQGVSES